MQEGAQTVLIFANGVIAENAWIRSYLPFGSAIIAANGGIKHLLGLEIWPTVMIGDLDSLPDHVAAELPNLPIVVRRHPELKDETDLELALLYAVERFPDAELLIFGGAGGRLDQTLANLLLLAHPRLETAHVRFVEESEAIWLVRKETRIQGRPGDRVSLIPIGGPVHVVETTGLRWPLHDDVLPFGPARGISNEMTAAMATVSLQSGLLLCIHTRMA